MSEKDLQNYKHEQQNVKNSKPKKQTVSQMLENSNYEF